MLHSGCLFSWFRQRSEVKLRGVNGFRMAGAAPGQLFLGIENSMAGETGDRAVCAITLYAPYWLDNRTGLDLGFQVLALMLDRAPAASVALRLRCADV